MEKAELHIQNEYKRNASIFKNWNDIRNADMKELSAHAGRERRKLAKEKITPKMSKKNFLSVQSIS